jgi:hypothetical protein
VVYTAISLVTCYRHEPPAGHPVKFFFVAVVTTDEGLSKLLVRPSFISDTSNLVTGIITGR